MACFYKFLSCIHAQVAIDYILASRMLFDEISEAVHSSEQNHYFLTLFYLFFDLFIGEVGLNRHDNNNVNLFTINIIMLFLRILLNNLLVDTKVEIATHFLLGI